MIAVRVSVLGYRSRANARLARDFKAFGRIGPRGTTTQLDSLQRFPVTRSGPG
jgi:hypothetical protein